MQCEVGLWEVELVEADKYTKLTNSLACCLQNWKYDPLLAHKGAEEDYVMF